MRSSSFVNAAFGSSSVRSCAVVRTNARTGDKFELLKKYVESQGGYVSDSIELSSETQSGSRGLVARRAVGRREAEERPLLVVPEAAMLTAANAEKLDAVKATSSAAPWKRHRSILEVQPWVRLALLLAYERRKGAHSQWWPYIDLLGEPSCGWWLPAELLPARLRPLRDRHLGELADEIEAALPIARRGARVHARQLAAAFGCRLTVTQGDILWSLGHMLSRSFGSGRNVALVPILDLCNGSPCAPHQLSLPRTRHEEGGDALFSRRNGAVRPLKAGEEIFVAYGLSHSNAFSAFLNFGFVPTELLAEEVQGRAEEEVAQREGVYV